MPAPWEKEWGDAGAQLEAQKPWERDWSAPQAAAAPQERSVMDKLLGRGGERTQLWPERLARSVGSSIISAAKLPGEVYQGKVDPMSPEGMRRGIEAATLVAPGAPAIGAGRAIAREAAAPTAQLLKAASKRGFDYLKESDTVIRESAISGAHSAITKTLNGEHWYGDINAPQTFKMLDKMNRGKDATVGELMKVREALGKVSGEPQDEAAAAYAQRLFDDYLGRVRPEHIISGDPAFDATVLRRANADYRGFKRSEALEGTGIGSALERAERQAGKSGVGANVGNTLRQRIDAILNSKTERAYFSDEELAALRKIVVGTTWQNLLRKVGKFAPTSVVSSIPAGGVIGGTAAAADPLTAALVGAAYTVVTHGAKAAEEAITRSAIRKIAESIRRNTPTGRTMPTPPPYSTAPAQAAMGGTFVAGTRPDEDALAQPNDALSR
jgi:hypothetical protein